MHVCLCSRWARALRYAATLPPEQLGRVVANDIDAFAAQTIAENATRNGLGARVEAREGDAAEVLRQASRHSATPATPGVTAGQPRSASRARPAALGRRCSLLVCH